MKALANLDDVPLTAKVSWQTNTGAGVGHLAVGNCHIYPNRWHEWWPPERHYHHYTTISTYNPRPNPIEAAFKIVAKMIEKGIIEDITLKRFIALVDDVADIVKGA